MENKITIEQLAYRIAERINSAPRAERDITKGDISFVDPLPMAIYGEFYREFPAYTPADETTFKRAMHKHLEA